MFRFPFLPLSEASVLRSAAFAVAGPAFAALLAVNGAQAAPMTFTDRSAFDAAIAGMTSSTLDFDSETAGTLVGDGDTLGGITFNYTTLAGFGVTMQVLDDFDTTSPENYLGLDMGGAFIGGDEFDLALGPVNAIGMYFITTPGDIMDDDLTLTVGATMISLVGSDIQDILADGGEVYFLGIVDSMSAFTVASISGSGDFFEFTVDDIVTAVIANGRQIPEPGTLALLGVGLAGLGAVRGRRIPRA